MRDPSRDGYYARLVLWDDAMRCGDDVPLEKLAVIKDAEELCRQLLASPWSRGSSTRHTEAVELLARVHASSELPASFVALLVITCQRWDRVTSRLIAAVEESGLLGDADLDELSESVLSYELVISYPLTWVSPQWLDIDLSDGTGRAYTVDEGTLGQHRPSFEPPLRRWAARRALQKPYKNY